MGTVKCIIFDLDDTLVESGSIWVAAQKRLFTILGSPYHPEWFTEYLGMNAMDAGKLTHRKLSVTTYSPEECGLMLRQFLLAEFDGKAAPMPGAEELIPLLSRFYALSIASGSPQEVIAQVIQARHWDSFFSSFVSSEEVPHGKPEPDVFLEAAQRLRVPPDRALVIEDGLNGIRAARKAGMYGFLVKNPIDHQTALEADRSFLSLSCITLDDIQSLQ
ncbi:MAG: HAD family phosphatase [Candidatus Atribacteria bacterium]|nr:HAD family phosphatase [Candidatus Atribacteria bacterium]